MAAAEVKTIAELYDDDAVFLSHPFRDPESPAAYAEKIFTEGRVVSASFEEPLVDGDRCAVAYKIVSETEEVRGVTILRFDERGRVTEHRDYWASISRDL